MSREVYVRVIGTRKTIEAPNQRYRREWILPGRKLIEWVEVEQARMAKASPQLRKMAAENKGIYPMPLLQLSSLEKGVHDTHKWVLDYEVDIDHGYHYEEKIILDLQQRRKVEEAMPRKYEFIYHSVPKKK